MSIIARRTDPALDYAFALALRALKGDREAQKDCARIEEIIRNSKLPAHPALTRRPGKFATETEADAARNSP